MNEQVQMKKRRAKFYVLAFCCAVAAKTIPEVCVDADVEVRSGGSTTSIILQRRNLFRTSGCRGQLSTISLFKTPPAGHSIKTHIHEEACTSGVVLACNWATLPHVG